MIHLADLYTYDLLSLFLLFNLVAAQKIRNKTDEAPFVLLGESIETENNMRVNMIIERETVFYVVIQPVRR